MSSTSETVCTQLAVLTVAVDLLLPAMLLTELGLLRCLYPEPGRVPPAESGRVTSTPPLNARPSSNVLMGCCMHRLEALLLAMLSTVLAAEAGRSANRPAATPDAVCCCSAIVSHCCEEATIWALAVFARMAASAAAKSSPSLALQALSTGDVPGKWTALQAAAYAGTIIHAHTLPRP